MSHCGPLGQFVKIVYSPCEPLLKRVHVEFKMKQYTGRISKAPITSAIRITIYKSRVAGTMVVWVIADTCGEVTGCDASCQEVGRCSIRSGSWEMYITFASAKHANKAEPDLALKPRVDVIRNPK